MMANNANGTSHHHPAEKYNNAFMQTSCLSCQVCVHLTWHFLLWEERIPSDSSLDQRMQSREFPKASSFF